MARIWHTTDSVSSVTWRTRSTSEKGFLGRFVTLNSSEARLFGTNVSLAESTVAVITCRTRTANRTIGSVSTIDKWEARWWIVTALRSLNPAGLALLKGLFQRGCLSPVIVGLFLQPSESLDQLIEGLDEDTISVVKVEDGNITSPVGVKIFLGVSTSPSASSLTHAIIVPRGLLRLH